jgi:hypothetical protein
MALVVAGSRTEPRAHPAKYAWEGDVGPVDRGDAITTTFCRLTDKSRIGSGGLAGGLAGSLPLPSLPSLKK